ncbi:uncharacterized protein LOC117478575 [Trematomus bernacchii]|uniref:uncharacterized protein LOC117478575 n=1 Tax=Trematomus bernacchii TaxID=40690 RepID=UPI00146B02A3|nr:uncharacterized protein LOC117478575 [Trematomus bernacchii]
MEKVLLIIIALSGLSAVSSHAERQYHFVYEAKTMSEAQRYCREKHTDLATVDSMEVVELLNDMAGQYKQSAWIGLYDDRDSWKWSMSDPSFYEPGKIEFRQWASGEPGAWHHEQCTFVNSGGTWGDQDCNHPLRVVCFDVTGPNATFVLIDSEMTWTEAQSYCREHHTDLASVRNLTENQQIVELLPGGYYYWIGLYRDPWKWSDGSNSSFKYWKVNEPNHRGLKACVAAAFDNSGEWEDLDCGVEKPFICYGPVPVVPVTTPETSVPVVPVTTPETSVPVVPVTTPETSVPVVPVTTPETSVPVVPVTTPETSVPVVPVTTPETSVPVVPVVPVSMKVIKVKVENPNGVDLNDPAFLDAMLVEAKKNLRAQGLDDNVQLAWRKQPDGQVFHEEEEEKRDDKQLHIYSLRPKEKNREETRMEKVLLIIIALSGLSAVSSHAERQYHFVSEAKTMSEAQRYCREKHTDLATVDSMEVVELLNNMAGQYNQSAWIGLYDDRDSWKWSMSDPSFYEPGKIEFKQWGSGEPGAWHHEQCTFVNSGGTWGDQDCNHPLRVVCFDVTGKNINFKHVK